MAQLELARGYKKATNKLGPVKRDIVILPSGGGTNPGIQPPVDPKLGEPALVVSGGDPNQLETIEGFVRLLEKQLDATSTVTALDLIMDRLIDIGMQWVTELPQPAVLLDQARRNADFRADFLKRYDVLSAAQVHDLFGSKADNTAALAGHWRSAGKVFGVEHRGRILYPAFQFDDTGSPKPVVATVLKALGRRPPWQVASWFTAPNGWLPDDQCPIQVMDADPDTVADAAHEATRLSLL